MDRLREAWNRAVRGAFSRIDYFALYRARVVAQNNQTVDVTPDDKRLPGMQGVRLRHGVPGLTVTVQPGCYILVGWEGGNPKAPYACLWDGGEGVTEIVVKADNVYVGDKANAEPIPLGNKLLQRVVDIESKFDGHTHVVTGTCPSFGGPLSGGLAAATATPTAHSPDFASQHGKVS